MKNDVSISFITSPEMKISLDKIAEKEGLTVSTVIESIISNYFKENKTFTGNGDDRRRFERKQVSLPAFISNSKLQTREFESGTLLDVSFGGIKFSIPKVTKIEVLNDDENDEFSVTFNLPDNNFPITIRCRPMRVSEGEEHVNVSASFVKPDCTICLALQNCLV